MSKARLIDGYDDGTFKPTANATRAEAATMIYNALHIQEGAPSDDIIANTVLNYEKSSIEAMQLTNLKPLYDLNEKVTFGKYKALSNISADKIKASLAQGYSISVILKRSQAKVIEKSALSATVQLDETMEMNLKKGTFSQTTTIDTNELLYLRNMDHSWKIYDQKRLANSKS